MAKASLQFRFVTRLEPLPSATGVTHIAPVPAEIASAWKKAKVRRLMGSLNGVPVKRALQNHADGGSFIMLGRPLLKEAGAGSKSAVVFDLGPDPTPDELDVPDEMVAALDQDPEARARWDAFTVGRRRSLLHYVTSAKQEATRIKRAIELTHKLRTYSLSSDVQPASRAPTRPSRGLQQRPR